MEVAASAPPHPSLAPTLGVLQIGLALGLFCSGVLTLQAWNYFRVYAHDILIVRGAVAVVHCIDLFHSALVLHSVYQYAVRYFGDYDGVAKMLWSFKATSVCHGVGIFLIQLFFCRRVYYLERSTLQLVVGLVLATGRFVFNVFIMSTCISADRLDVFQGANFRWQVTCLLTVGLASDLAITFCICRSLLRQRSGIRTSDGLVDRLVAFTIGSGLLTSIVALGELVSYLAVHNYTFLLFFFLLGKVYSNAFLASLNERDINRVRFEIPKAQTSARFSGVDVPALEHLRSRSVRLGVPSLEVNGSTAKAWDAIRDARLA